MTDKTTSAIDLVERVARAIHDADVLSGSWENRPSITQERYRRGARAAIAAQSDTITRLQAALTKIVAPYDRDGCMTGERYSDAVWIAKEALSSVGGE